MKQKYFYFIVVFLIVFSFIAFGRVTGNDFINFDDPGYILENGHIKSGFSIRNIKWALTSVVEGNWHPLTLLSHTMDWSIFKANPGGHHLVSLLLHIGAVIFLFLFLMKTTNNIWSSAFVAAFFGLHPLRVESVAWASERKDVLSMFLGMGSIYMYAFYAEGSKSSKYYFCLILFALSLMSKPTMVTLPFVMLLMDYWPLKRLPTATPSSMEGWKAAGRLVLEKIPFFILSITSSSLALWAQHKDGTIASDIFSPLTARMANAIVSYVAYLSKIFWPADLAVFYLYEFSRSLGEVFSSTIIIILITCFAIHYLKRIPFLFVGWFWYLGTLIPVIGLVQIGSQAMADRYTYFPQIGLAVILAWGIPALIKNEKMRKTILFPTTVAFIALITLITWKQCGYWKNDATLFKHTLRVTKNNYLAHNNLGAHFFESGQYKDALYHFNKAIVIKPDYFSVYINRGNTFYNLAQYQLFIDDYTKALNLEKDYAEGYFNRGNGYYILGNYQKSISDYDTAITLKPDFADAYNHRGTIYYNKLNQHQKAIDDYNKAITLKPDFANAYHNRAFVYLNQGNRLSGCRDARKACELGLCSAMMNAQARGMCR